MSATPETWLWTLARGLVHAAFFLAFLVFLWRLRGALASGAAPLPGRPAGRTWPAILLLTLLFAGLLVHQASWHLTGHLRPPFVSFMQSHDRRQFNPAHRIQRGAIRDRRGEVLAYSEEILGQVYRLYPDGPAFVHAIGYSHPRFGASGIEALANVHLNGGSADSLSGWGELGRRLIAHDKRPRGQDLTLTLDAELQRAAFAKLEGRRGAVVMLRPDDGAIRVLVSTPAPDPNRLDGARFQDLDPERPLLNRATQGLYPPGSTFKIVLAAQAIESGFRGTLDCPAEGYATSARYRPIRDVEYYAYRNRGAVWPGHGALDLRTALAKSSNVFFARLGVQQGQEALQSIAERMGFNRRHLLLHRSPHGSLAMRTGQIPRLADNDLYGLAQLAIGQGRALATPAQMALIAAAVANRGLAMRPRLIETAPPDPLGAFMAPATADRLTGMMRAVMTQGTGRSLQLPELAIAGKTGTAQNPHGDSHSWFVGFAPAERPAWAIAVLVEGGGYGSAVAGPIARDLLALAHALESGAGRDGAPPTGPDAAARSRP